MPEIPMKNVGYLVVHVTTARGAIPLEGAAVNIRSNEDIDTIPRADIYMLQPPIAMVTPNEFPLPLRHAKPL